jgi:hypothetical protein
MPDASLLASDTRPQATSLTSESGSVNINVQRGRNTGSDVVGFTVEQVSIPLTQISSTFPPRLFGGRCPYLGLDAFSRAGSLLDVRSDQSMKVFIV